ncbi:hypothetical protein MET9862_00429 [Methylobacterium symbioticum]|uniref:Uncharacterized protein n=1 Tax=Methylobacterium symbioticum TaxID=2584084 RepID=A0A509E8P6_9HYPH|nr:hypothetical protein MET9862_00429 [Methylobacterium symbioticum]
MARVDHPAIRMLLGRARMASERMTPNGCMFSNNFYF